MTRAATAPDDVRAGLSAFRRGFTSHLEALFDKGYAGRSRLGEAMRYSLLAGGKRLRPFLALRCCVVCGGPPPISERWFGSSSNGNW